MLDVWDLCRPESVRAAQAFQEGRQRGIDSRDVALALQEAVTCSSQARQTPLHAAAELGDASMVKVRPSCLLGSCTPYARWAAYYTAEALVQPCTERAFALQPLKALLSALGSSLCPHGLLYSSTDGDVRAKCLHRRCWTWARQ